MRFDHGSFGCVSSTSVGFMVWASAYSGRELVKFWLGRKWRTYPFAQTWRNRRGQTVLHLPPRVGFACPLGQYSCTNARRCLGCSCKERSCARNKKRESVLETTLDRSCRELEEEKAA